MRPAAALAIALVALAGACAGDRGHESADLDRLVTLVTPRRLTVIAHRGGATHPENTIAAILGAAALGADFAEVDVRLTKDGVAVLLHDQSVDRTTDGRGPIASLTLAEVKRLDAGRARDPRFAGERIPTLVEALRAARGKIRLLLDVPVERMAPVLAAALRDAGSDARDVVAATWDDAQRREFQAALPGVTLLYSEGVPDRQADWSDAFFAAQRTSGIAVFEIPNWSREFIVAAHKRSMPVWVYTVNDEPTMRALIDAGADGIETDVPELAIRLAREQRLR
jgi:glycerophosphoryl diester phosphodiesterase